MSERIENLRMAIETMHGCKATHEQSIPIIEMFGNKIVWEGIVESFALKGHAKAKRCYAWSYQDGKDTQYSTILEIPPVDSAQSAVRIYIASHAKK